MNEAEAIEICREAIVVMLKLVGPIMLAGLLVGITVSMVQTVTQIQEQALTFIPKMIVVFGITIWLLPFMLATLGGFTHSLTDRIVRINQSDQ
jgi:flagellar biosynthetic protein FliQ